MKRKKQYRLHSIFIIILLFLVIGCEDKMKRYERPEWLEPPIYQRLEKLNNFNSYLYCIDKANLKIALSSSGYYTVFAPTDEAFSDFLSENNLSSVEEIDSTLAWKIVSYSLVYNMFLKDKLDDFQSYELEFWDPDKAYKRKTAYSKWIYLDSDSAVYVADQNRSYEGGYSGYNSDDKNNKHIPFFTEEFLQNQSLTSYDYEYFFPESEFSGFNVAGAQVLEQDLLAENGVIHVVDKVTLPFPNLEELLASNPEYSTFKNIIDTYIKEYNSDYIAELQEIYEYLTGKKYDIYIKWYPGMLFGPNCENYYRSNGEEYDAQIQGFSMFVPTNEAVESFFDSKFLKYYDNLETMPVNIISHFVNVHLFPHNVWPSKFDITVNAQGETPRFDIESEIIEHKIASNGMFYGVNKVQEANMFYSVYGDILLNDNYKLMTQALETSFLSEDIISYEGEFTVFILPDEVFEDMQIDYTTDGWKRYSGTDQEEDATQYVTRLIKLHVVEQKLDDLTEHNIIKTAGGEYIRYGNALSYVWGPNNRINSIYPRATNKKSSVNGVTWILNRPIEFIEENVGLTIETLFPLSKYLKYIKKSYEAPDGYGVVYDPSTYELTDVKLSEENTILIPTDAAIDSAVAAGYLPEITDISILTQEGLELVKKFVMYHIISSFIVIPDGKGSGEMSTKYVTLDGKAKMTVNNEPGNLTFIGLNGNVASLVDDDPYNINIVSNKAVIHQIDNFLGY